MHQNMNNLQFSGKRIKYPKILLTGYSGQLGFKLSFILKLLGDVWCPNHKDFDLSSPLDLRCKINFYKPDLIVNAAAYTNVEEAENNIDLVRLVNATAPKVIAEEANKLSIPLVHFSTDYIFDGMKTKPYIESDEPNPINNYGLTKLEGEQAIQKFHNKYLILRTSWVYSKERGNNFYTKMLKLFNEKEEVHVINDQISKPTSVDFISEKTFEILSQLKHDEKTNKKWNIYHLTNKNNAMSYYEFASNIYDEEKMYNKFLLKRLLPIDSYSYKSLAKRPKFSVLDSSLINNEFQLS